MAECNHEWVLRPGGKKEGCSKCGTGRIYDPDRCDHEWTPRASGKKEGCVKCGAGRNVVLNVQDAKKTHKAESPT